MFRPSPPVLLHFITFFLPPWIHTGILLQPDQETVTYSDAFADFTQCKCHCCQGKFSFECTALMIVSLAQEHSRTMGTILRQDFS